MFASGFLYVALSGRKSYFGFIWHKFKRLMIPYFVTSVVVITIKLCAQGNMFVQFPITARAYVSMFYLPETGSFLWFVWTLWWMFVVVSLFKSRMWHGILFLLGLVLAYLPWKAPSVFYLGKAKDMFVYFMLGIMIYEYRHMIVQFASKHIYYLGVFSFIVVEIIMLAIPESSSWADKILPYLGIFTMFGLCQSIEKSDFVKLKSLLFGIAAYSYAIYLFHTTFMRFAEALAQKLPLTIDINGISYALLALFVVVCGVIFPILLYRYVISKSNITRFLFGFSLKKE